MLNTERCKNIEPEFKELPDEEILKIRDSLYGLGHLIFEDWIKTEKSSKYPARVLQGFQESNTIKPWLTKDQKQE